MFNQNRVVFDDDESRSMCRAFELNINKLNLHLEPFNYLSSISLAIKAESRRILSGVRLINILVSTPLFNLVYEVTALHREAYGGN